MVTHPASSRAGESSPGETSVLTTMLRRQQTPTDTNIALVLESHRRYKISELALIPGGRKIGDFRRKSSIISETVRDGPTVTTER